MKGVDNMIKIISKDKYFVDVRFFDQITISYSVDNSLNIFENIKKAIIDTIDARPGLEGIIKKDKGICRGTQY